MMISGVVAGRGQLTP